MVFQIRTTGGRGARKHLQTDDPEAVKRFLLTRNPDLYEIYGMAGVSGMELRFVEPARKFLNGISERAEATHE